MKVILIIIAVLLYCCTLLLVQRSVHTLLVREYGKAEISL